MLGLQRGVNSQKLRVEKTGKKIPTRPWTEMFLKGVDPKAQRPTEGQGAHLAGDRLQERLTLVGLVTARLPFSSKRGPSSVSSTESVSLLLAGAPLPCAAADPLWEDIRLAPRYPAASACGSSGALSPRRQRSPCDG